MPILADIQPLYRGEDVLLTLTVTPTTDVTGWTISFRLKQTLSDAAPLLTINATITNATAGIFTVAITSAQMLTLLGGTYVYDIWRTDAGSNTTLTTGTFTAKGSARFG